MTTKSEELKPCPFGQGTPIKDRSQYGHFIRILPTGNARNEEAWRTPYFASEEELLAFWNTRKGEAEGGAA